MAGKRVLFLISNIGDYHAPRLLQLQEQLRRNGDQFLAVETASTSAFYNHSQTRAPLLKRQLSYVAIHAAGAAQVARKTAREILRFRPHVVFVLGYTDALSMTGLTLGLAVRARVVFLSDSKADDQPRTQSSERIKSLLVRRFYGAQVAGERHKAYFASLGLRADRIRVGYDVIDNDYFAFRANQFRHKAGLIRKLQIIPERYVLLVSRFIARKRIDRALRIYAASRLRAEGVQLVIIGQGPEESRLKELIRDLGIANNVTIRHNVRNASMPLFYAFAEALMLTSEYDQWGLSVNESMVCGTPALVTQRCGCAGEIVLHGKNGFVWDGEDVPAGTEMLEQLVLDAPTHKRMSEEGVETMRHWGLRRFADTAMTFIL